MKQGDTLRHRENKKKFFIASKERVSVPFTGGKKEMGYIVDALPYRRKSNLYVVLWERKMKEYYIGTRMILVEKIQNEER